MTNAFANLEVNESTSTSRGTKWSNQEIAVATFLVHFNSFSTKDAGVKLQELFGNKRTANTVKYKITEVPYTEEKITDENGNTKVKRTSLSNTDMIAAAVADGKTVKCRSVLKYFENYQVNPAELGKFLQEMGIAFEGSDEEQVQAMRNLAGL